MYESYWKFNKKPFENVSDDRFYYPSETHQGALLKLRYAIESRRGAALLAGPSGSGKTLLVRALRKQLSETYSPLLHVVFPQMPAAELLRYIADGLDTTSDAAAAGGAQVSDSVQRIERALADNASAGHHAVIVIDEAQLLAETGALETMRLLLNFETDAQPNLTLLLVGQTSLLPTIDRMGGLEERLGVKTLLRAFTAEETAAYVNHRLRAAGSTDTIFQSETVDVIHALSHGIPRRINRLCDLALLVGFAEERTTISPDQIESVSEELVAVAPE
ncbi:MAG: AAA family ATPase [Planctomycetes bacterium]|nr:AAA family ATPase [Planctomycetota bacterium]